MNREAKVPPPPASGTLRAAPHDQAEKSEIAPDLEVEGEQLSMSCLITIERLRAVGGWAWGITVEQLVCGGVEPTRERAKAAGAAALCKLALSAEGPEGWYALDLDDS